MTIEPTMELARSEVRKATISAISSGCAARPMGAASPVLGKTTRAVADHAIKDIGDDVADSDRVDADAVLDGFERERAGQLGWCAR